MKRKTVEIIVAVALVLLVAPLAADAQQPAKVTRIGYLTPRVDSPPLVEAFRQRLRELGYVEGQNIAIEFRFAPRNLE